jgi:hypothetical protein
MGGLAAGGSQLGALSAYWVPEGTENALQRSR